MNVKPLVKYFPELHHLPVEQQLALLESAYQASFGPEQKLRIWRNNLVGCGILTAAALLVIVVVGPSLKLPPAATAAIMILGVLPGFFFIQHKRYINELRPQVARLLARQSDVAQTS